MNSSAKTLGTFFPGVLAAAFVLPAVCFAVADDGAASIAAGGLVPRRETRVVMAKEVLHLGGPKVVVDYDFRNDTNETVTTEVAFPVPTYKKGYEDEAAPDELAFRSFKLWVGDKPVQFQVQATATVKGKDVTAELEANHIDIATFGHFKDVTSATGVERPATRDFDQLPRAVRTKLVHEGLFELLDRSAMALWTVQLQYHWTQTFPAHGTVHIRHEYTPVIGSKVMSMDSVKLFAKGKPAADLDKESEEFYTRKILTGFCLDDSTLRTITNRFAVGDDQDMPKTGTEPAADSEPSPDQATYISPRWIDFILTTANTWQRPIEDFTLIVHRAKASAGQEALISFCSPGKVEKVDADDFRVHLTNFIPKDELHIGFFCVPVAKGHSAKTQK